MKRYFWLLCYVWLTPVALAQQKDPAHQHADSVYQQIRKLPEANEKARNLLDLSFFMSDYDSTASLRYIQEAREVLGSTQKQDFYAGLLAFHTASVYFDHHPERAKRDYLRADEHFRKTKDPRADRYRVRLWSSYGALLQREGRSQDYADVILNKSIPMARKIGDSVLTGNNYQNLAAVLMNMKQLDKAEGYYQQAIALLQGNPNAKEERLTVFVNAARNALFQQKYTNARFLLDSASRIVKGWELSPFTAMYYSMEGTYFQKMGLPARAIAHFEKGLQYAQRLRNGYLIHYILFEQYELYASLREYASALKTLHQVLPYVEQSHSLRDKQMVYYNLARTETHLQHFREATGWFEQHKQISDSLALAEADERVLDLEKKYQTSEKENELLKIRTESQTQALRLEKNRTLIVLLLATVLLLLGIGFFLLKSTQNKRMLALQKEKLLEEELKNVLNQDKLNRYNAMLEGQEIERNRVARDLHDGLGGLLAAIKLRLSALAFREKTAKSSDLTAVIQQLDHSVNELRRIARDMMPEALLSMGLEPALRDLCQTMNSETMNVSFEAINLRSSHSPSFLIGVYRIVQELLANALKHSGATQVWVQASEQEGHFYLVVEDDGKGFDPNLVKEKPGIGLSNIRNRVELLNGNLEVESQQGTSVHLDIQLHE